MDSSFNAGFKSPLRKPQGKRNRNHTKRRTPFPYLLADSRGGRVFFPKRLMEEKRDTGALMQGTLDMLILKTLTRGEMHGYAIAELIRSTSLDVLRVEEGALYPALHRLELRGLLASEWGLSENNRRAKYYRLTRAGRKQLSAESDQWRLLSWAVTRVMEA